MLIASKAFTGIEMNEKRQHESEEPTQSKDFF